MKKILLILLACLPLFAIAKDNKEKNNSDPKYLAGALTYEDGKITFTREINAPGLSKDEIYQRMLDWANERFQPEDGMQSRVVYTETSPHRPKSGWYSPLRPFRSTAPGSTTSSRQKPATDNVC